MKKVIKCGLDSASIGRAINELRAYRESLDKKVAELVQMLTMDGVVVARTWVAVAQGGFHDASVDYLINSVGDITAAQISLNGKDALFIEFGAGIHYNGSDPPHAAQFGYGVGTYNPSSDNAFNPDGWYYYNGTQRVHSYGTEGTYPLYHAAENARNNAIQKAVEIFSRS